MALPLHVAAEVLALALPNAGTKGDGGTSSFLLGIKAPRPDLILALSPSDSVLKGFLNWARAPERLRLCQDVTQVSREFAAVFPAVLELEA